MLKNGGKQDIIGTEIEDFKRIKAIVLRCNWGPRKRSGSSRKQSGLIASKDDKHQ